MECSKKDFSTRVLPFDSAAAIEFASVVAQSRATGRAIGLLGAQIASIALARGASIATRDGGFRDFWSEDSQSLGPR